MKPIPEDTKISRLKCLCQSLNWRSSLGKVSAFQIPGMELWFNSRDHLPYHFHAKRPAGWEIRVAFLECTETRLAWTLKWALRGRGPDAGDRARLLEAVLEHREALLLEWDLKVSWR